MKRPSLMLGALLGGATGLAVMALLYLGTQAAGFPFVPFDLFEWLTRALPGALVISSIETMVKLIGFLNLGSTDQVAKQMEQLLALALALGGAVVFGAVLAWAARRDRWSGLRLGTVGGVLLFLGTVALEVARGPSANSGIAMVWLAVVIVGWGALLGIWVAGEGVGNAGLPAGEADRAVRRALLRKIVLGSLGLALASSGLGWLLGGQRAGGEIGDAAQAAGGEPGVTPSSPLPMAIPEIPPGFSSRIQPAPGTRPEVTPNDDFYRIDINVNLGWAPTRSSSWQLEVAGLFDRPRALGLSDLMSYPAVTQPITLSCISNPVGGDLISTGYWTGARLGEVLTDLGLRSNATALRVEALDGFYETVEMADMMDPRTLLVYGMGGKTLPVQHGFPLRIYIPNRYGMKQPKWITRIEAMDHFDKGYWVRRGWSHEARPRTTSVIDHVALDKAEDGKVPVGGIAWAGDRGIQKVEVQVDDGPWQEAMLRVPPLGPLTWVQWRFDWTRVPGRHAFRVRATDGTGALQEETASDTFPDGAAGYHSVVVNA